MWCSNRVRRSDSALHKINLFMFHFISQLGYSTIRLQGRAMVKVENHGNVHVQPRNGRPDSIVVRNSFKIRCIKLSARPTRHFGTIRFMCTCSFFVPVIHIFCQAIFQSRFRIYHFYKFVLHVFIILPFSPNSSHLVGVSAFI